MFVNVYVTSFPIVAVGESGFVIDVVYSVFYHTGVVLILARICIF